IILFMIAFCAVRLAYPEFVFTSSPFVWWNSIIRAKIAPELVQTFDYSGWYYLPIMASYIVWVIFIANLYEGYFQYILVPSPFEADSSIRIRLMIALQRAVALAITPIGVMAVLAVSFTPALWIVPIWVCGTLMGILLVLHGLTLRGRIQGMVLGWGAK